MKRTPLEKSFFFIYLFLLFFCIPRSIYSSETFSLQTGAFSSEKNARNLVEDLKKQGIECTVLEKEGLYKVYCGAFSKKSFAYAFQKTLSTLGYKSAFVVSGTTQPSQKPITESGSTEHQPQSELTPPLKKGPPEEFQESTKEKVQEPASTSASTNTVNFLDMPLYNLKNCLALAAKNNPLILSAEAKKLSANANIKYQKALLNPTLDFSIESGYVAGQGISPFTLAKDKRNRGTNSTPYYNFGPDFQYPIFKEGVFFGREAPTVKKAEDQFGVANNYQMTVQNETFFRITEAYVDVLKIKEDMEVQKENVKYLQFDYEMAMSKYNLSLLTKDELMKAEAELLKAKMSLENAGNSLTLKKINLAYWMGIDPLSKFEISDTMDDTFYTSIPTRNLEMLIEKAYQKNPQILQQTSKVEVAKEEVTINEKKKYPDIDLNARLKVADDFDLNPNALFHVFLRMRMPIFNFGRVTSAVEEARYKLQEESMTLLDLKNSMAKEIAQIITDIKNLENLITSEKKAIESAQEFYNHMQESFALNTVTLSSVLEAQYKLLSAKIALVQLNYDYRLDYAKLMKTVGEIPLTDFQ